MTNALNSSGKDKKKMVLKSLYVEPDMWTRARERVGVFGSLSEVIRKLLRLWLEGKINLDDFED